MVLVNVVLLSSYAACFGPLNGLRRPLQIVWCRWLCWLAGLRLKLSGVPRRKEPTLFVANHVSYLDIPVISSYAEGTFVAKADVSRWPLFGQAARLTRTIFIQRVGAEARTQSDEMIRRLHGGENLILFPEGTSTDGADVAGFKSTLFSIAERAPEDVPLKIQPVSITYARSRDGTPLTGWRRQLYCWYGDMTMFPHLMRMLSLPGADVELRFLEVIEIRGVNRKELARRAHAAVAASVATVNAALATETEAGTPVTELNPSLHGPAGAEDQSEPAYR